MDDTEREDILDLIATGLDPRRYDAYEVMRAEAERILAAHDRVVAANAWDEAIASTTELVNQGTHYSVTYTPKTNPYRITEENN